MTLKTNYVDGDIFTAGSLNEITGSLVKLGGGYRKVVSDSQTLIQRDVDAGHTIIGSITLPAGSLSTYAEIRFLIYASTSLSTTGDRKWQYNYELHKWSDVGSSLVDSVNGFWKATATTDAATIFWAHATYDDADLVAGSEIKFVVTGEIEETAGTTGSGIMTLRAWEMEIWGV